MADEFCSPFDPSQCWGVKTYDKHLVWTTSGAQLALDFLFVRSENAGKMPRWIATPAEGLGARVRSITDGTVAYCGDQLTKDGREWSYGNAVVIRDAGDPANYTVFAHLSLIDPALFKGSRVKKGQIIGNVGKSGSGSNDVVHLHFERLRDEKCRDNWKLGIPQDLEGLKFGSYAVSFKNAYRSGIHLYLPVLTVNSGKSQRTGAMSTCMPGPYNLSLKDGIEVCFKLEKDDLREAATGKVNFEVLAGKGLQVCINGCEVGKVTPTEDWQKCVYMFDPKILISGKNRIEFRGFRRDDQCQVRNMVATIRYGGG